MRRKTVSGIMLTLLLIGMLTLAFNIQPVESEPTTIIVPDDYEKIQWAINNASEGDTIFVKAGTYYEHVTINKSLSLIGENTSTTIIDGNNTGTVVYVTANTVTVEGFTVQNGGVAEMGIHLVASNNSVIQRNVVKQHSFGIFVDRSNNCQISGNIAKDGDFGIFVVNSRNCTVGDNTVRARVTDIRLGNSRYCVVINNTANCYGHGIYLSDSPNCGVSDNTAVKTSGFSDGNCITLDNSDNCIVSGNTANKNTYGIFLAGSSNVTISNNTANNNKSGGIELEKSFVFREPKEPSNNCTIVNNIAISNDVGIYLSSSQHSIVRNNIANNNWWWGIAILWGSNNCIISDNTVNNNPWGSIIVGSYECKFSNNTVSNNEHGLELAECSDNHIYNNNLINNTNQVFLRETYNNTLHHNNFINSTSQVYDWSMDNPEISPSINTWDNGYPSGGNYWSDYIGVDLYSGPYQNETGSDGIGDTPYVIDENNADRYPLMKPWTPTPPVIAPTIDIDPDALNLKSKGKWITCYIELIEGYDVSDIDRATILLNGTIPVDPFWVGKPLKSVIADNDDDGIPDLMVKFNRKAVSELILSKCIMYENVTLTITMELFDGTLFEGSDVIKVRMPGNVNSDDECLDIYDIVIPEFPSFLILPILMIATLLAVIVYRRHSKKYQINS